MTLSQWEVRPEGDAAYVTGVRGAATNQIPGVTSGRGHIVLMGEWLALTTWGVKVATTSPPSLLDDSLPSRPFTRILS